MISSMVIVYREVLEMSIVLGVLLAATGGMPVTRKWIAGGSLIGLIGAAIVAWFMEELESAITGNGEFIFNAVVLSLAAFLIAWTVIWMRQHGREMAQHMHSVGQSVIEGKLPLRALLLISLAAVMREGSEAVFFLFGSLRSGLEASMLFAGGVLGVVLGVVTGLLIYRGLIVIPVKQLFTVTGVLLTLLAAGMASQAAWNLVAIDMLPPLIDPLWNSSAWLPRESMFGEFMGVLVGYDDRPSGMQFLVFVVALTAMLVSDRLAGLHEDRRLRRRRDGKRLG